MYYVRFPLSLRQVEDILHDWGIDICHETVRFWWNRFGLIVTKEINKLRPNSYSLWRWHLDEIFVKINGVWAGSEFDPVDRIPCEWLLSLACNSPEGTVLDCIVTTKWDRRAALKLLKKLISRCGSPQEIVTDKLGSYRAALREFGYADHQEKGQYQDNQCENSHAQFRRRERAMCCFRSIRSLQNSAPFNLNFITISNIKDTSKPDQDSRGCATNRLRVGKISTLTKFAPTRV